MTDEIPQNPSEDLAARWPLMVEFETIARAAMGDDPDAAEFRVTGATLDVHSRTITPRYAGVPAGRRATSMYIHLSCRHLRLMQTYW